MELESLKRQLAYLDQNEVEVQKLVTDRHIQFSSYMATERPMIEHGYDVWHVGKGNCFIGPVAQITVQDFASKIMVSKLI